MVTKYWKPTMAEGNFVLYSIRLKLNYGSNCFNENDHGILHLIQLNWQELHLLAKATIG